MAEKSELVKLGALWIRKDKSGKTYLSGRMGDAQILIFENQFKEKDNHPDYMLYVTTPRPRVEDDTIVRPRLRKAPLGSPPPSWDDVPPPSDNDMPGPFNNDDEIPF